MPRTAISATALSFVDATTPVATTVDSTLVTNGVDLNPGGPLDDIIIRVANTAGSNLDITIQSGANPPAHAAGQGDLVEEVAATTGVELLGPFEGARFAQANGHLYVDFETGFTGTIEFYRVPRA